jgi:antitoxin MazE
MQVAKWGNSLAIRLPAVVVEALKLKEGDVIEVQVAAERRFEVQRPAGKEALLARLRKFQGRLPADFHFDRLEANDRKGGDRNASRKKVSR